MTSETDYPRQRTVAELLAEHGGGAPSGRRRRRRAAEDEPAGESTTTGVPVATDVQVAEPARPAPVEPARPDPSEPHHPVLREPQPDKSALREPEPHRPVLREPQPDESVLPEPKPDRPVPSEPELDRSVPPEPEPNEPAGRTASEQQAPAGPEPEAHADGAANGVAQPTRPSFRALTPPPPVQPPRVDQPTAQIPQIGGESATRDVGHTSPIERLRRASPIWRDALDAVERTERELREVPPRNGFAGRPGADDGGPPTQASAPLDLDDDHDDTQDDGPDDRYESGVDQRTVETPPVEPRPVRAQPGEHLDSEHDEYDEHDGHHGWDDSSEPQPRRSGAAIDEPAAAVDLEPRRRLGRAAAESAATGPAWALVLGQWVLGAVGGAALWVGFRFLWRSLPVVAVTAALLITFGLIVLVRALLRSKDWRTTGLAVLVGLLLTVSPALLVLVDR